MRKKIPSPKILERGEFNLTPDPSPIWRGEKKCFIKTHLQFGEGLGQ